MKMRFSNISKVAILTALFLLGMANVIYISGIYIFLLPLESRSYAPLQTASFQDDEHHYYQTGRPIIFPEGYTAVWSSSPLYKKAVSTPAFEGRNNVLAKFDGNNVVATYDAVRMKVTVQKPASGSTCSNLYLLFQGKEGAWFQFAPTIIWKDSIISYTPGPCLKPGVNWLYFSLDEHSPNLMPVSSKEEWSRNVFISLKRYGLLSSGNVLFTLDEIAVSQARDIFPSGLAITGVKRVTPKFVAGHVAEIELDVNRSIFNPYDPEEIDINAQFDNIDKPGYSITRPAFFYVDSVQDNITHKQKFLKGHFRVRFMPEWEGNYRVTLTAVYHSPNTHKKEKARLEADTIKVLPASEPVPGFVKISERYPHYFEFSDTHAPFFPIGLNLSTPSEGFERVQRKLNLPQRPYQQGADFYYDAIKKMQALHMNSAEIWIAPWSMGLEWNSSWDYYYGLEFYNQVNAKALDRVLTDFAQHHIFAQLVVDTHSSYSYTPESLWWLSPYNENNTNDGGRARTTRDVILNEEMLKIYKNKLRYVAARWGADPEIYSYIVMNEIDLLTYNGRDHGNPEFENLLIDKLVPALRQYVQGDRLISVHYAQNYHHINKAIFENRNTSFIAVDAYTDDVVPRFMDTVSDYRKGDKVNANKPFHISEFGGDFTGDDGLVGDIYLGLWSSLFEGHAGAPFFWWNKYILYYDLTRPFTTFCKFIATLDPTHLHPAAFNYTLTDTSSPLLLKAVEDDNTLYLWVLDEHDFSDVQYDAALPKTSFQNIGIHLSNIKNGMYEIEQWDLWTGEPHIIGRKLVSDHKMAITAEMFKSHTILKIRRQLNH